jgi:hypothetical protein
MCLGCLFVVFASAFPRLGLLIMWLFTDWIAVVFGGNWLWPLLGFVFLPFTTLIYVFVSLPPGGVTFGGWLLVGLVVVVDVTHWGQIIANRQNGAQLYNQYSPTAARS